MRLSELITELERVEGHFGDDDPEVRIAYQPSWPLAAGVANVCSDEDAVGASDEPDEEQPARSVVWIAATSGVNYDEHPYAPRGAWEGTEEVGFR